MDIDCFTHIARSVNRRLSNFAGFDFFTTIFLACSSTGHARRGSGN